MKSISYASTSLAFSRSSVNIHKMPITKSAKKALRASARKRIFNMARKDALKDLTKEFKKLVAAGNAKEATTLLPKAFQAIDKAAKTKVIEKNTAARKKSRLAKMLNKVTK